MEDKRFRIKEMLMRNILTQTWLVHQLKKHGVQTDQTELSAVLNGRRKGNKATKIMITSLNILNDYEEWKLLNRGIENVEPKDEFN